MQNDLIILLAVGKRLKELGISPDSPVPEPLPPQRMVDKMKVINPNLQTLINQYDLSLEP